MSVVSGRHWLSLGLLLSVSACKGDGATIEEVCELALSCSCTVPPYATVDACVADYNAEEEMYKSLAASNGLRYNDGCYATALAQFKQIGCGTDFTGDFSDCSESCSLIHGDKPLGAACTNPGDSFFSDCGDKLFCADGTCIDLCTRLSAGAPCLDAEDSLLGLCADELYCDYESLTCKARQGAGGPCDGFDGCNEDLVCGDGGTCEVLPKSGEACTGPCAGDLVCEVGVCSAPPGEGESCEATFYCGSGLECDDNDVCVAAEPLLCEVFTE